jgi:hypothetical protein
MKTLKVWGIWFLIGCMLAVILATAFSVSNTSAQELLPRSSVAASIVQQEDNPIPSDSDNLYIWKRQCAGGVVKGFLQPAQDNILVNCYKLVGNTWQLDWSKIGSQAISRSRLFFARPIQGLPGVKVVYLEPNDN